MSSRVGLDFHQKLLLMRESNPERNHKRGQRKQPSTIPPPVDICVIEDESETTPYAQSKTKNSSMPSFKLIDEELGEEGELSSEIQANNCKAISEQTIFDHIREKAKNFPVLTTSNACSASPDNFLLGRKRLREKDYEVDSELGDMEERERSKIPPKFVLNLSPEPKDERQDGHDDTIKHPTSKNPTITGSSATINITDDSGMNTQTQDTIFGHIRRKTQNFPVLSRTMQSESLVGTKEHSFVNQPDFGTAAPDSLKEMNSDKVITRVIASDLETSGTFSTKPGGKLTNDIFSRSPCGSLGSHSDSPKVPNVNTDLSSIKILPFDFSMIKDASRLADSRSSPQQFSPNGAKRQCCSLELTSKNREVDSFLGFKSVFSFL